MSVHTFTPILEVDQRKTNGHGVSMASDVLPASIETSLPSDGLNNSRLVTVGAGTGLLSEWDPPDYGQMNLTAGVSTSESKTRN
jgi:hypothetical protein